MNFFDNIELIYQFFGNIERSGFIKQIVSLLWQEEGTGLNLTLSDIMNLEVSTKMEIFEMYQEFIDDKLKRDKSASKKK